MPDYSYGLPKTNGHVRAGAHAVGPLEAVTISTNVNILPSTDTNGTLNSQLALDKLIEVVSNRGQPINMLPPTKSGTIYSVTVLIEHPYSWANAFPTLVNSIKLDGVNYGFAADTTLTATING